MDGRSFLRIIFLSDNTNTLTLIESRARCDSSLRRKPATFQPGSVYHKTGMIARIFADLFDAKDAKKMAPLLARIGTDFNR
ncbi:MAG: hypothetical protein DRP56_01580 [Planctomycetota bacterium]|nr:MAG: hypothetical protein DRP56_01580 [Planctomycetota bacterium]